MLAPTRTRMTAEEYLQLPETHLRMELINGELFEGESMPAPLMVHQDIVGNVFVLLKHLMKSGKVGLSPLDIYLDNYTIVQPDIFWVAENSACTLIDGKYWQGAPDLVVEVLSESTAVRDKKTKFKLYEKYGTREYWLIDPAAQYLEVWHRVGDKFEQFGVFGADETFESPLLAKSIVLKDIFTA